MQLYQQILPLGPSASATPRGTAHSTAQAYTVDVYLQFTAVL